MGAYQEFACEGNFEGLTAKQTWQIKRLGRNACRGYPGLA